MIYESLNELEKDHKKLLKRYKTLEDDMFVIKKVLAVQPAARPPLIPNTTTK